MISKIADFFRPSCRPILAQRQPEPPPDAWYFEGWKESENGETWTPCDRPSAPGNGCSGSFEIEGFVIASHVTREAYAGGARLHLLFSPDPPRPGFRSRFERTKEGGLASFHNHTYYTRQLHIVDGSVLVPRRGAHVRVRLRGQIVWCDFLARDLQSECEFRGWDDRITCPVVRIDECKVVCQKYAKDFITA